MRSAVVGAVVGATVATSSPAPAAEPKPSRGFQLALRTGAAVPFGKADKSWKLSDFSSAQVPLIVDIGGKPSPHWFLGGYVGLGFGGAGGITADYCDQAGGHCVGVGLRVGLQAQAHLLPGGRVNPWLGYGIGYESIAIDSDRESANTGTGLNGLEFVHAMGGADFRLSQTFGLGPFVDVSLGRYTRATDEINGERRRFDIEAPQRGTHGWVSFGLRLVLFP